jgi:hypothetical protein
MLRRLKRQYCHYRGERTMRKRSRPIVGVVAVVLAAGVVAGVSSAGNKPMPPPTGERVHAQSVLEPVFNAENYGQIGYINTPNGTQHPVPVNPNAWSPIYLPVYPNGSTISTGGTGATGPLNCWHTPAENCLTHGNEIAGLAMSCPAAIPVCSQAIRNVYANGVLGHDHIMDFHGGADWNVAWEPIIVLFTKTTAANTRLLTDTQIADAVAAGNAVEIPLPGATFHCSLVSDSVWALTTPLTG